MTRRSGWELVLARLYVLVAFAFLIVTVLAILAGNYGRAGFAAVSFFAVSSRRLFGAIVVVVSAALGEWAIAAFAAVGTATKSVHLARGWSRRKAAGPEELASMIGGLPEPLHARLRGLAGSEAIATWHMVAVAVGSDPQTWRPLLGTDPGSTAFDGDHIADHLGGPCTGFAAEAAGLATEISRVLNRPLNVDTLAVAASVIPYSCAQEWVKGTAATDVLRGSESDLTQAFTAFGRSSAGARVAARVEQMMSLSPMLQEVLTREQLAALKPGRVGGMRAAEARLWIPIVRSVVSDALRSRAARRGSGVGQKQSPSSPSSVLPTRSPPPAPSPTLSSPSTMPTAPPTRSGQRKRRRLHPLAPWGRLPRIARVVWVLGRPLLAIAAIGAAAADGRAWLIAATAAATFVRGLRWPWLSITGAGLLAVAAPVVGALLVGRILLGEVVLVWIGAGGLITRRRDGLDRIVAARKRLLSAIDVPTGVPSEVESDLDTEAVAAVRDHDRLIERVTLAASRWAEARPLGMLRAVGGLIRGVVLGRWGEATGRVDFSGELRRLFIIDAVLRALVRLAFVIGAGVTAAVLTKPTTWFGHGEHTVGRFPAAVGAALLAILIGRSKPRVIAGAIVGGIVWIALGRQGLTVIGLGVAWGIATHPAGDLLERVLLRGPDPDVWLPTVIADGGWRRLGRSALKKRLATRALREYWLAADEAANEGRRPLAIDMLDEMARVEADDRPALAIECHARIALWHLESGQVGAAADRLDLIDARVAKPEGSQILSPTARLALGLQQSYLGDDGSLVISWSSRSRTPSPVRCWPVRSQ